MVAQELFALLRWPNNSGQINKQIGKSRHDGSKTVTTYPAFSIKRGNQLNFNVVL